MRTIAHHDNDARLELAPSSQRKRAPVGSTVIIHHQWLHLALPAPGWPTWRQPSTMSGALPALVGAGSSLLRPIFHHRLAAPGWAQWARARCAYASRAPPLSASIMGVGGPKLIKSGPCTLLRRRASCCNTLRMTRRAPITPWPGARGPTSAHLNAGATRAAPGSSWRTQTATTQQAN